MGFQELTEFAGVVNKQLCLTIRIQPEERGPSHVYFSLVKLTVPDCPMCALTFILMCINVGLFLDPREMAFKQSADRKSSGSEVKES